MDYAFSPKIPLTEHPLTGQPPPISLLSDYMFLAYQDACSEDHIDIDEGLDKLQWIFHHQITNDQTKRTAGVGDRPRARRSVANVARHKL